MTGSQRAKRMRHRELVTGASWATLMCLDFIEYRSFTKQSEVTVFKPKEGFSGFHVETRLMWGKCQSGSPKGKLLP